MPEQHLQAGEVDEAEEVLDVVLPTSDEAAEVVHPGEKPLHFPTFFVAPQLSSVLGFAAPPAIGRDQLDAVVLCELLVEPVRVVGFVADEPGGELIEKASGKNLFHKLALGWRSALHRYGERKTVSSSDSDDFRALAAAGGADSGAPFLALAKVESTNASSKFNWPRSCRCLASRRRHSSSFPLRTHCSNLRWQVWNGGYFSGSSRHCAPVPCTHSTPWSTARVSCHGRPRLSARRCGRSTGSTTSHCSSFSSQRPRIGASGDQQSISRMPPNSLLPIYETGSSGRSCGEQSSRSTGREARCLRSADRTRRRVSTPAGPPQREFCLALAFSPAGESLSSRLWRWRHLCV